jgi:exosortase
MASCTPAAHDGAVLAMSPERWRSLVIPTLVFTGLLALLYSTLLQYLVAQWWSDDNYSHGFLVPVVSAYFVWQRRRPLATAAVHGDWIGWPVLVGGIAMLLLGDIAAENFLMRSSLIVIVAGLVLVHLGRVVFRLLAFPLAFLFFMIPLPATVFYAIALPLQTLAASNAASVLDALGVPVLLDGNVIHLSRLTLGVAEACSGIRSLISLLALAVACAYITLSNRVAMVALVASVVPITVAANAVRIVATGLIGEAFGVEYARGVFHTFSSWLIFVFAFVCLLAVHWLIRRVDAASRRRPA